MKPDNFDLKPQYLRATVTRAIFRYSMEALDSLAAAARIPEELRHSCATIATAAAEVLQVISSTSATLDEPGGPDAAQHRATLLERLKRIDSHSADEADPLTAWVPDIVLPLLSRLVDRYKAALSRGRFTGWLRHRIRDEYSTSPFGSWPPTPNAGSQEARRAGQPGRRQCFDGGTSPGSAANGQLKRCCAGT